MKCTCTQHGCEFEADEHPEVCPVCNNPQNFDDVADVVESFEDLTIAELKATAKEWGLSGYSRFNKDDLIALLEAAESDAEAA